MGFQNADIIILALIAVFVVLRLRNTLGKDIGHRPETPPRSKIRKQLSNNDDDRVIAMPGVQIASDEQDDAEDEDALAIEAIEDPAVAKALLSIKKADDSFSVNQFIEGSKSAFEWVLNAYDKSDKATLKSLMSKPIYQDFAEAIETRDALPHKPQTTLIAIDDVKLTDASLTKQMARITVQFTSQQIEVTRDESNEIIDGNASQPHEVLDEWIFERSVQSRTPNWTIIET